MQQHPLVTFIVILCLCTAVLAIYPVHYQPGVRGMEQSGYETLAVAESLIHGGGFANPFLVLPTGPTAHLSPTFPLFLAMILKSTPDQSAALFAIQWSSTLVVLLQLCLLPWLAHRMRLGFYAGVVAAALWLIARMPREDFWEQNYSGLLIALVAYFMYKGLAGPMKNYQVVLGGVLWGVLILTSPVAILALLLWLLLIYRAHTMSVARTAVLLLLPILVVAPWMMRNYQAFHKFVFVRDNFGLELNVSNNPCARFSFELNRLSGCYEQYHPNENIGEAMAVRELGEIGYNKRSMVQAKSWIKENRAAFLTLTVKRSIAFWVPSVFQSELSAIPDPRYYSALRDLMVSISTLAAVAGLVLLWKTNRAAASVLLIWLFSFPVVYYITQYGERARLPILWAILLPAGFAATELVRKLFPSSQAASQKATSAGAE